LLNSVYHCFRIEFLSPEAMMIMEASIPAELLDLKTRLDQWRADRKHLRQPMPAELRQAAIAISQRYPRSLVRRVLKVDPWRLNKSLAKKSAHAATRKKQQTTFFKLPIDPVLPESLASTKSATDCRLQLERPDGARLSLTLPRLDLDSITRLADFFLRGHNQ
jgi:hypothetical protein